MKSPLTKGERQALAANVFHLLEAKKMLPVEFGEKMAEEYGGLPLSHQQALSKMKRMVVAPGLEVLQRYSAILGKSVEWMVKDHGHPLPEVNPGGARPRRSNAPAPAPTEKIRTYPSNRDTDAGKAMCGHIKAAVEAAGGTTAEFCVSIWGRTENNKPAHQTQVSRIRRGQIMVLNEETGRTFAKWAGMSINELFNKPAGTYTDAKPTLPTRGAPVANGNGKANGHEQEQSTFDFGNSGSMETTRAPRAVLEMLPDQPGMCVVRAEWVCSIDQGASVIAGLGMASHNDDLG